MSRTTIVVHGPRKGKLKRGTKAYRAKLADYNEALHIVNTEIMAILNNIEVHLAAVANLKTMREDIQKKLEAL